MFRLVFVYIFVFLTFFDLYLCFDCFRFKKNSFVSGFFDCFEFVGLFRVVFKI